MTDLHNRHFYDHLNQMVSEHYLRRRARDRVAALEVAFPSRNYAVRTRRFKVPRYAVERIR